MNTMCAGLLWIAVQSPKIISLWADLLHAQSPTDFTFSTHGANQKINIFEF